MDEARFWAYIERNHGDAEAVAADLMSLPAAEIEGWHRMYYDHHNALHRWDLWGAAHVIMGGCAGEPGCSDDGFHYFKAWVIGKGRAAYTAAMAEPDSLGQHVTDEDLVEWCWNEALNYAAEKAYAAKYDRDKELDRRSNEFEEPLGESWDEGRLPEMFPKLAARFSGLEAAIRWALIALLERTNDDAFVIFEDRRSHKFVQFAGSRNEGLTLDLPTQPLDTHEMQRAIALFAEYGTQLQSWELSDRPGGHRTGIQSGFQVDCGRSLEKAAALTVRIFSEVYRFPKTFKLKVTEN